MTPSEAIDVVNSVFWSVWKPLNLKAVWSDIPGSIPTTSAVWARVTARHVSGEQSSLIDSLGHTRFRRFGVCIVQVFAPMADGLQKAYEHAEKVLKAFENARKPVWFRKCMIQEIGSDGAFQQVNVSTEFEYDSVRPPIPAPILPVLPSKYDLVWNELAGDDAWATYKLDASAPLVDSSGNERHALALINAPTPGLPNGMLDDAGDGVGFAGGAANAPSVKLTNVGNWSELNETTEWTIAAWAVWNKETNVLGMLLGGSAGSTSRGLGLWLDNRTATLGIKLVHNGNASGQTCIANVNLITSGVPFFLVGRCSSVTGQMRIFIDGVDSGATGLTTTPKAGANQTGYHLGSLAAGTFGMAGQIDDLRIAKRAFTVQEIAQLYGAGKALT